MAESDTTPFTDEELKRLAVRLAAQCVRREYCTSELYARLAARAIPKPQIMRILNELIRRRFVDDGRYTHAFVRTKLKSGWGRRKIAFALRAKKIPEELISAALSENSDEDAYLSIALKAAGQKVRNLDLSLHSDRAKLYRFLASRGYESAIISRVITSLCSES